MVSKAELNKRRVKAERATTHQHHVAAPADRRRRRLVTFGTAFLALMLILPLTAGLIAVVTDPGPDQIEATVSPPPTTTEAAGLVDAGFEGQTLIGPTPCPATDGTEQRTTTFSEAPPMCIGPDDVFDVRLDTLGGILDLSIDAALAPQAANVFVTLARYGVYEGAPIYQFPGVVTIGGLGDAGFSVADVEPPADGKYPVGSVVMLTDFAGAVEGQIVIVTDETGSAALEAAAQDPIIGTVTAGLDAIDELRSLQRANDAVTYRVQSTVVSTTG